MREMFGKCTHLSSLDLSNFNTLNVVKMPSMFDGCSQLEYLNLKNFIENITLDIENIFTNVPDNVVVCLNENSNKILNEIKTKNCYSLNCSDSWKTKQKKIVNKPDVCLDISHNTIFYNYEYNGLYYENCSNGILYNQCYKDPKGYYLDMNESIYKKCYYSCEKCTIKGNNITHNCLECNNNYPLEIKNYLNYSNCFQNCSYYYYFDEYNNFHCTINNSCPKEFKILDGIECKKAIKIPNMEKNLKNCLKNKKTKEMEIICYDKILKDIEDIYTSKKYDTSNLDNGNDEIIKIEKIKVILTTTENQKKNINNDTTNIILGECENSLRRTYNLSNDEMLYIKILEISQKEMNIPKVEYDVYAKLNGKNLTKLSLNSCQNDKISLLIPVNSVDNIDKLDSKSGYYNDFCYTATSDSGTDITLKDRKNEYPSKAVCQDGCDFVDYDYNIKKAKCSCKAKESSASFSDMKIDKIKLLGNFKNIKNIVNLNILKCVKILFCKKGILKNVGFFIFVLFIIFHTIVIILFYLKKLDLLLNKIKEIIIAIKYTMSKKEGEKNKELKEIEQKEKKENDVRNLKIVDNNIIFKAKEMDNVDKKLQQNKKGKKIIKRKRIKILQKDIKNYINKNNTIKSDLNSDIVIINIKKNEINLLPEDDIKKDKMEALESIMGYNDDEMNDLSYDLALEKDKRSYCQFYISLIKTKHEFIYTFFYNKDYNSKIIKIDLFIFGFSLNYAVNALFFNDETMHNVYESKGLFDISYQLPIIVYSSFISMFLSVLMQKLGLSSDAIADFKQNEETNNINERGQKLIRKLKIKFIIYFILVYILLLLFWYYISMFDAVYRHTQFLLLKDTLIGFALSLFTPFILYLLPGFFRIPALSAPNRRCLYNFSKIFTIL